MTKDEIRAGLAAGRTLVQEEWCAASERQAVDELIEEGVAVSSGWEYKSNFQCEVRKVRAK